MIGTHPRGIHVVVTEARPQLFDERETVAVASIAAMLAGLPQSTAGQGTRQQRSGAQLAAAHRRRQRERT
jgi:hypothetical protein